MTFQQGDHVIAGGLTRRIGRIVRLKRRYRQDGADVQWPGEPYTRWQPLNTLTPSNNPYPE